MRRPSTRGLGVSTYPGRWCFRLWEVVTPQRRIRSTSFLRQSVSIDEETLYSWTWCFHLPGKMMFQTVRGRNSRTAHPILFLLSPFGSTSKRWCLEPLGLNEMAVTREWPIPPICLSPFGSTPTPTTLSSTLHQFVTSCHDRLPPALKVEEIIVKSFINKRFK